MIYERLRMEFLHRYSSSKGISQFEVYELKRVGNLTSTYLKVPLIVIL